MSDSKYIPQPANKIADKLKMKGEKRIELFVGIEILLKKGIIVKKGKSNFLILIDGIIHNESYDESDQNINMLNFEKTEINLSKFKTKSTTFPKLQEKNTIALLNCFKFFENKFDKYLNKDSRVENCEPTKSEIREEINKVRDRLQNFEY